MKTVIISCKIIGKKALQSVNYTELMGNELILSWYRPGGIRDKLTGNLFVKNIHEDVKAKDLYNYFSTFGIIFSCRVKYNNVGKCKGYGYVQFENIEDAKKALEATNGKGWNKNKIEVCPFKARENRNSSLTNYNNLFVKCIPKTYTNENLKSLFVSYGEIISAVVVKETTESNVNKGFGFVCYKNIADAKIAEEKMKDAVVEGQKLFVSRALSKDEHKKQLKESRLKTFKDCNLYVKELPDDTNDEKLKVAFAEFGNVISARVMMEKKQNMTTNQIEYKSRGFGFVCFSNKEEAKKAMTAAPTKEILGRILYVNIAQPREERIARAAQMNMFPPPFPMGMYGMPPQFYPYPYPRQHRNKQVFQKYLLICLRKDMDDQ